MNENVNQFNLIDEPWIPVVGYGLVSLKRVFSDFSLIALGGNPIQKISIMKLLLAIAQLAYTPVDEEDWKSLGSNGLSKKALEYLEAHYSSFWLMGEKPFLQMKGVQSAVLTEYGAVLPQIATGNTTVLLESQVSRIPSNAEKALILIQLMGFGLGGKKVDNSIVLSPAYIGKTKENGKPMSGKPGSSVGFLGFLHNIFLLENIINTLYINLITKEQIQENLSYTEGVGEAPWDQCLTGEDCTNARKLKTSLIGRLIPMGRFVLLEENGLRYSEGVIHLGYKEGMVDPTVSVDNSIKDPKVIWVDPERRPWRFLTSLLAFVNQDSKNNYDCFQLRIVLPRLIQTNLNFSLWSGGLRVSSNAGEQYVSGSDDFVESELSLNSSMLGKNWFVTLKQEMTILDELAKITYGTVFNYLKDMKFDGKDIAAQASNMFWALSEKEFQNLLNACGEETNTNLIILRRKFAGFANKCYEMYCPQDTSRQLDSWASHRPQLWKYLN